MHAYKERERETETDRDREREKGRERAVYVGEAKGRHSFRSQILTRAAGTALPSPQVTSRPLLSVSDVITLVRLEESRNEGS